MRTINVNTITENIKDMCIQANHFLADDMDKAMKHALETEEAPLGRQILDQMHANDKKIKVITGTIRKDRNESLYDLEKYDDEIARLTQGLNEVAAKKKEALGTFENVTKNILQDEIEHGYREKIADLDHQYEDVKRQLQLTSAEVKARRLTLTDQYGSHLGKEFLDPFKLQDLSNILQQGRAANISEAISVYQEDARKH